MSKLADEISVALVVSDAASRDELASAWKQELTALSDDHLLPYYEELVQKHSLEVLPSSQHALILPFSEEIPRVKCGQGAFDHHPC